MTTALLFASQQSFSALSSDNHKYLRVHQGWIGIKTSLSITFFRRLCPSARSLSSLLSAPLILGLLLMLTNQLWRIWNAPRMEYKQEWMLAYRWVPSIIFLVLLVVIRRIGYLAEMTINRLSRSIASINGETVCKKSQTLRDSLKMINGFNSISF